MFLNSFIQMLPILIIAAGGYLTKNAFAVETQPLVKITADFFMPMLVFHALYHSDLHGSRCSGSQARSRWSSPRRRRFLISTRAPRR